MGIIVVRHEMSVIELAPLGVNYDQTAEEMIAEYAPSNNSDITSEHFPKLEGKTGVVEERLCLVRPVPTRQVFSDEKVEETIATAGYSFEEWPSLGPLKEHADELWGAGIWYVIARGPNSRWRSPGGVSVVCFHLDPESRGFDLWGLAGGWSDGDWFFCRKSRRLAT